MKIKKLLIAIICTTIFSAVQCAGLTIHNRTDDTIAVLPFSLKCGTDRSNLVEINAHSQTFRRIFPEMCHPRYLLVFTVKGSKPMYSVQVIPPQKESVTITRTGDTYNIEF